MNWQMMSAIGSILCALASTLAAIVALYIGRRDNNPKIFARAYFCERSVYETLENHPNCFSFECVSIGNKPVRIMQVLEKPHFKRNAKGLTELFRSLLKKRNVALLGRNMPDLPIRKYWFAYKLDASIELIPGEMIRFDVPFQHILQVQTERKTLGFFDLDRPLVFYVVDMTGKRHKVKSSASPNSFLTEGTCKMTRVSAMSGLPIEQ